MPRADRASLGPLLLALAATAAAPGLAQPQPESPPAPIRQVLVHPDGATVQRVLRVAAGTTLLRVACLPAGFDADSLQLSADAGIALGDLDLQTLDRAAAPECAPADPRMRELEDQRAVLQAELAAQDTLLAALKAPPPAAVVSSAAALATYADALRRSAQDALLRQHALTRRLQALDAQLAPLRADSERAARSEPRVRRLTVRLATRSGGALRLSYRVQAGWTPVYRAHLDAEAGQVRLERLAQVAQSSGEDWTGVALRLSTSAPATAPLPPAPRPWILSTLAGSAVLRAEVKKEAATAVTRSATALPADEDEDPEAPPPVVATVGRFETEFAVPGTVDLRGGGQQLTLLLDPGSPQAATVFTRVQPQQSAGAWLVAELPRPAGDWPAGPLQLYRDGNFIGQTRLQAAGPLPLTLGFGRDERLRVTVAPVAQGGADTGVLDRRIERRERHAYTLENTGSRPMAVQVLEPTPVPQHDEIRVEARLDPAPLAEPWRQQPGIRVWALTLAAGQQARLSADVLISQPRDLRVYERR